MRDMPDLTAESASAWADRALAEYRDVLLEAVGSEAWGSIVHAAVVEAMDGDYRARDWLQRSMGLADTLRTEVAVDSLLGGRSFSSFLAEVAEFRARRNGAAPRVSTVPRYDPRVSRAAKYWATIFDVLTPAKWQRIVAVALAQAQDGDERARDWLTRVLGADDCAGRIREHKWGSIAFFRRPDPPAARALGPASDRRD